MVRSFKDVINFSCLSCSIITLLFLITHVLGCKKGTGNIQDNSDCFNELSYPSNVTKACGHVFFSAQVDKNKMVSIFLDEEKLDLSTICKSYKIEDHPNDIEIRYYTYRNDPDSLYFSFCTDMFYPPYTYGVKTTWLATSGIVTATVSQERASRDQFESFTSSVKLENIRFVRLNSSNDTILTSLVIKDRKVDYFY